MVFSSSIFLFVFLPLFFTAYATLPFRNVTILCFSLFFYAWGEGLYVALLLVSIVCNYWISKRIDHGPRKRLALAIGVGLNLIFLFYFKYFGFVTTEILGLTINRQQLPVLPLGISFFTFQAISYLVDVYRHDAKPANSVLDLGLYISMFPQLIAGPIVRYASISQAIRNRVIEFNDIQAGFSLFIIGLSQKLILADKMALVADDVFSMSNASISTTAAWSGVSAYTLQIYFDFSAYSLMAIGLGRIIGFHLPRNFDYPYQSTSLSEFWRRWHISLSTWFRDYLYIPLGGNQRGKFRTYLNLIIVFTLCGIWHGAAWNFLLWGYFHGSVLVIERIGLARLLKRLPPFMSWLYLILVVMVGWVFFRAENLDQAITFLTAMAGFDGQQQHTFAMFFSPEARLLFPIAAIASFPVYSIVTRLVKGPPPWLTCTLRIAGLISLALLCMVLVVSGSYSPFIYFRF
ncbi:alginate regulatory protein [Arenicella chitinivorans]|uniref:Probable alginate O-acetylase n=1 Tax=Arenicella chitinivorans TaxID=1329800 RepID=A0A918RHR3_9GAMM|nr:MBOAT family O-acyltransferase [Arenicella chitinivorans]GHA00495.1 alginate regulatory protein [Arenicella chitinivorans]